MEPLAKTLRENGIDPSTLENHYTFSGQNIYVLTAEGSKAVELWRALRAQVEKTGRWPVILGGTEGSDSVLDSISASPGASVANTLSKAEKIDAPGWFTARRKQQAADIGQDPLEHLETGKWPAKGDALKRFTIPTDILSGKPLPSVKIALAPTKISWEAPAWLNFGGWNECPMPEVQVAVLKYWHEKYGAEVVGISHDVMELQVARRPANREAALQLAREQCLFCEDIVTQGVGSIEALAVGLLEGDLWYFWWD